VLHDLVLHHSRATRFLDAEPVRAWRNDPANPEARDAAEPWLEAWRDELVYSYPDQGERLFLAHLGTVGDLLPYAYPLVRLPVEASRMVAVHSPFLVEAVREEVPGAEVARAPQPASRDAVDPAAVSALRKRLGFRDEDVVVGVFGLVTPEKRIDTVARAVARAAAWNPRIRLLLVGTVPDRTGLDQLLERRGVAARARVTGRVPLEELGAHIEAADIVGQLRYPTARETSAALLRALAQGRPTVISDLAHQSEYPDDIVVRADLADEEGDLTRALLRLADDPRARRAIGERAAAWIAREHAPARVRKAWERVLERARDREAAPPGDWPAHWPRP
jgi:glycosyltransferase involved in cell wall biosynthesis